MSLVVGDLPQRVSRDHVALVVHFNVRRVIQRVVEHCGEMAPPQREDMVEAVAVVRDMRFDENSSTLVAHGHRRRARCRRPQRVSQAKAIQHCETVRLQQQCRADRGGATGPFEHGDAGTLARE